jgi:hypothetical protein
MERGKRKGHTVQELRELLRRYKAKLYLQGHRAESKKITLGGNQWELQAHCIEHGLVVVAPEDVLAPSKRTKKDTKDDGMILREKLKYMSPRGTRVATMSEAEIISSATRMRLIGNSSLSSSPLWTDLPNDVAFAILGRVIAPKDVLSMMASSKSFHEYFSSSESLPIWKTLWDGIRRTRPHACVGAPTADETWTVTKYHKIVALTCAVGCARCRAPRIQKITWEFEARLCPACINMVTLDMESVQDAGVPPKLLTALPFFNKDVIVVAWGEWATIIVSKFLRRDIDRVVREEYGDITFEAYKNRKEIERKAHQDARDAIDARTELIMSMVNIAEAELVPSRTWFRPDSEYMVRDSPTFCHVLDSMDPLDEDTFAREIIPTILWEMWEKRKERDARVWKRWEAMADTFEGADIGPCSDGWRCRKCPTRGPFKIRLDAMHHHINSHERKK